MNMVSYENVTSSSVFSGVRDDEEQYTTSEQLYEDLLAYLSREFLKDKYSLCLQVRDGDKVVYEFPKVPCPGLFLEQLEIGKI